MKLFAVNRYYPMDKMRLVVSRGWFIDSRRMMRLSQSELADLFGVDRMTVWRWENSRSMVVPRLAGLAMMYLEKYYERTEKRKAAGSKVTTPLAVVPGGPGKTPADENSV